MRLKYSYISLLVALVLASCNNKDDKKVVSQKLEEIVKKDSVAVDAAKPPTINILDTVAVAYNVICMKDSASTIERVGIKLAAVYGAIGTHLSKVKIAPIGQPMAWYKSDKAPFFFEAGLPVAKLPSALPKNMFTKIVKTDSATVAHFYGPYELLSQGYNAVKERLKDAKKVAKGMPYEIYVSDPIDKDGKPVDAYKVRTDIIFPWH